MEDRTEAAEGRRLFLRRLSYVLLAVSAIVASYPWWSGLYTRYEQARMREVDPPRRAVVAPARTRVITVPPDPFEDWETHDAAYWRDLEPGQRFGMLAIPAADIDVVVVKGVAEGDLKRGPGWLEGTALPGPSGNAVIAGHRTTYLAPFRRIDRLRPGDRIEFRSPFRVYRYTVFRRLVVKPKNRDVVRNTRIPILTLSACHPPYSAAQRIIVQARLESVERCGGE